MRHSYSRIAVAFLALGVPLLASASAYSSAATIAEIPESPRGKSATSDGDSKKATAKPQVEVFIPSVQSLSSAAMRSKTAELYNAVSSMISVPANETGEGIDFAALLTTLKKVQALPDTSLAVAVYSQDRDGRPRWLIRVDWPLEQLAGCLRDILIDETCKELFKNLELKESEDGGFRLELPEMELATLRADGNGSMIAASDKVQSPVGLFGQDAVEKAAKAGKKPYLAYCSLNLDAGDDEEKGSSFLSNVAGVSSIRYVLSLNRKDEWSEQFGITWNPLLGAVIKAAMQKTEHPFDCPKDAYAVAVLNLGIGQGMADAMTGFPIGTIGDMASGEMMFAAVPGTGFLPVPDVFYAFRADDRDDITESIREAIAKETKKRAEDDKRPRWREEKIDGRTVFWRDPAADGSYGMVPMTFRTVVFFDPPEPAEGSNPSLKKHDLRLVIANTSTWADDAVRRWNEISADTVSLPSSKKIHWQARVRWMHAYKLAHPYLSMLAGFTEGASLPPDVTVLTDALSDSDIQVRISLGGLRARHTGPIPIGAVYVPAVTAMALGATADSSSEAAREQVACRNLRVLHHHARLFRKDYGRWPATVAELDGYVDFASHPELLYLRHRGRSFVEGMMGALFSKDARPKKTDVEEEVAFDDSLYVITWSADDAEWRLQFRDDEFNNYRTIYIDAEGEIHRVAKDPAPEQSSATVTASNEAATEARDAIESSSAAESEKDAIEKTASEAKPDEPDEKKSDTHSETPEKSAKPKKKKKILL